MNKQGKVMYTINDLPKYSRWPARLLGIEFWKQRNKSKEEIDREFEVESWGAYLKRIKNEGLENKITTHMLDNWQCAFNTPVLYTENNLFFQDSFGNAHLRRFNIVKEYINKFSVSDTIVELGCGYGSVILTLAGKPEFKATNFLAAEYTPSGIELTKLCAKNQGIEIDVGWCDFTDERLTDLVIPEGALIFTCSATYILPLLPNSFITSIKKLKPSVVIHFEPIYEHYYEDTLLDMMRKRYIEVNDYNQNLLTLLRNDNNIQIMFERRTVIGINPLFSQSIIVWREVSGEN